MAYHFAVLGVATGHTVAEKNDPDLKTMSINSIKSELALRGLVCSNCYEKQEFVELLQSHWNDVKLSPLKAAAGKTIADLSDVSIMDDHQFEVVSDKLDMLLSEFEKSGRSVNEVLSEQDMQELQKIRHLRTEYMRLRAKESEQENLLDSIEL